MRFKRKELNRRHRKMEEGRTDENREINERKKMWKMD